MKKILFVFAFIVVIFNNQMFVSAATTTSESVVFNNVDKPKELRKLNSCFILDYDEYFIILTIGNWY